MRMVVTGDTHLKKAEKLPARLTEACSAADRIIHTGDWQSVDVLDELSQYGEVTGVYGNVDDEAIRGRLPGTQLLDIGKFRIGVVHGHGAKKTTEKRAIEAFTEDHPDVIIFGHSHIPMIRYFKKQLLVNPGSPTAKRALPYYSFAILNLTEVIHAELKFFD
ncbi:hypothetical protein SAMN05216238_107102 [Lentibacillus persicus]|uniref:Phosphoesterase n=1 Tax=Lentibacillus persicus TaxID=640948 RepID=A0A1I1X4J6_9BACI|nr:metallophosphoesterase family protein [Lentibacillus persicus]SFE02345.1 hypothetical protein SAMN05216238_107102 [Lentibacillus persicus]